MREYLMTKVIAANPDLKVIALELDENGEALLHEGEASMVYRLKLPMSIDHAKYLFAAIEI